VFRKSKFQDNFEHYLSKTTSYVEVKCDFYPRKTRFSTPSIKLLWSCFARCFHWRAGRRPAQLDQHTRCRQSGWWSIGWSSL